MDASERRARDLVAAVAENADCRRRKVGAVVVGMDGLVVGVGWNGARLQSQSCIAGKCPRGLQSYEAVPAYADYGSPGPGLCPAVHAEVRALEQAGARALGGSIYVTHEPCERCQSAIDIYGIDWIVLCKKEKR